MSIKRPKRDDLLNNSVEILGGEHLLDDAYTQRERGKDHLTKTNHTQASSAEIEENGHKEKVWKLLLLEMVFDKLSGGGRVDLGAVAEIFKDAGNYFSSALNGYDLEDSSNLRSFEDADSIIRGRASYGLWGNSSRGSQSRTSNPDFKIGSVKIDIGERQLRVNQAIHEASAVTGVPEDLAKGLWGVESSFGKNRLSPTGCLGDWQFTKSTFKSVIKQHGDKIPGLQEALKEVNGDVLALRDHPEISTYASQFYVKDLAKGLKIDVNDQSNWGTLYAAYNVGPGGVRKLLRLAEENPDAVAKEKLGFVAQVNPMFYVKRATASDALSNYQTAIETRLADHKRAFKELEPTTVASAKAAGQEITTDSKSAALASADATVAIAKASASSKIEVAAAAPAPALTIDKV